jgi:uncharacterized protein YijF (DUF1287 family)
MSERMKQNYKTDAKKYGFNSMSSYINHLLAANREAILEEELLKRSERARKDYKSGSLIEAKSLADL